MKIEELAAQAERDLRLEMRGLLTKRPMTNQELAEALAIPVKAVSKVLKQLQSAGANVSRLAGDKFFLHNSLERGGSLELKAKDRGDGWTVIGFISDNHLCNKHERLDVLTTAYDVFAREGCTEVLNGGNWVEGEARFNRQELIVPPGMDPQLDYWIERYPVRKGITTYYVTGDDHEGWWVQRECINVGQYSQMRAEKAGRQDLKYLGHVEADIRLKCGKGSTVGRLMHPGGGSAYALSYAPQKLVESFQTGEKPSVLWIGHYHKFDYCYPREVHVISGGCTVDQTAFLRKNKIAAHVGFSLVKLKQDPRDGHITRLSVEWNPFYSRGYYEKRFG
jgi:biotin operon repressor